MHMRLARRRFVYLIALLFAVAPLSAVAAAEAQYSEQELRAYAFANASVRLIQGGVGWTDSSSMRRMIQKPRKNYKTRLKRK
jgi:hypothetical protein